DVECLGERGRSPVAAEFAPGGVGAVEIGGRRGGGRLLASCGDRVIGLGLTEGVGGVADGAVARAAAEVAGQGVEIEAVGPAVTIGSPSSAGDGIGRAFGPVVFGGHRADEAGGAVAALGSAAHRHLLLNGVDALGVGQPLGGDDFLAVECR